MRDHAISLEAQRALTKLLGKLGILSENDLKSLSSGEQCPIAFFSRQGLFLENEAIQAVAVKLGILAVKINKATGKNSLLLLEDEHFAKISLERWRELRALPIAIEGKKATVAFANPLDNDNIKSLEFKLGMPVRIGIATEDDILDVLAHKANASHTFDFSQLEERISTTKASSTYEGMELVNTQESNVFGNDVSAAPIVRLVNKIFSDAIHANASDIHVNPEKEELAVRIRVDGIMRPLFSVTAVHSQSVVSRIKLLARMDIAEKRKPQDGRLRIKVANGVKDLRISAVPTIYGENLVIRVLTSEMSHVSFDSLGCDPATAAWFEQALQGTARVVLVTGPTGSGKTSTLYSSLLAVRDGSNNIITIEDPIEYRMTGINQIQVNGKTGLTFASGLRSILRQDPDVIMVGEIRDGETAEIAMQAAQTGHLVLSTLHTNTAVGAITRLKDLGIPGYVISASLGLVIAQRLIRKLCSFCAQPATEELPPYAERLGIHAAQLKTGKGCEECGNSGYQGRTALFSYLHIGEEAREAIRSGASEREILNAAQPGHSRSLIEAAVELINKGETSLEEVERTLGSLSILEAEQNGASSSRPTLPATAGKGLSGALSRRRVLLVEDDENTRNVLSLLLSREMFDVVEASDGVDALEKLYLNLPELIVCDIMMPRMNGLEFVKKLRRDPRIRQIPVLMLTAANTEENELTSLEDGADDFISKTADSKIFVARMHRLLERSTRQ